MITSEITHKHYEPGNCVFLSNVLQAQRYLEYLGPSYLYDIIWNSEVKENCLVFVFPRCSETKKAKELWDKHEL